MNQNCTCLTSLFLKLVISTLKKPLGGSEAQRSCREGLGMGCLPYKLPTSVSTPRRAGSDRAVPCRAATVSAFPRGREEGRCMVRIKSVSRCFTMKLPMDYKTPTTMTKTTNWRAMRGEGGKGELTWCSSMTFPLSSGKTIELYNGPRRGFLEDKINYKRTDEMRREGKVSFDC